MSRIVAATSAIILALSVSAASADTPKVQDAEKPIIVMSSQSAAPTSLVGLGAGGALAVGIFGLIIVGAAVSSGSH